MILDLIRGVIIILLILSFAGIAVWLWCFADRQQLDQAAHMPLEDDTHPASARLSGSVQETSQ